MHFARKPSDGNYVFSSEVSGLQNVARLEQTHDVRLSSIFQHLAIKSKILSDLTIICDLIRLRFQASTNKKIAKRQSLLVAGARLELATSGL